MVAQLGLRTHELLYEKIGNNIAEMLSAREKAKCYEVVANLFSTYLYLIQNNIFWVLLTFITEHIKNLK